MRSDFPQNTVKQYDIDVLCFFIFFIKFSLRSIKLNSEADSAIIGAIKKPPALREARIHSFHSLIS